MRTISCSQRIPRPTAPFPGPTTRSTTSRTLLAVLQKSPFPFELNEVTRGYFEAMARIEPADTAADMRAILKTPPDEAAIARLSKDPRYNSTMRTTCVPTMLAGGHAYNALPQSAEANVNCRIFPGHSPGRDPPGSSEAAQRSGAVDPLPRRQRNVVGSRLGPRSDDAAAAQSRR